MPVSSLKLLVNNVKTKPIASTLNLRDHVTQLFNAVDLLSQESSLNEVAVVRVVLVVGDVVHRQQRLVHRFLQFQSGLERFQRSSPFHACRLGDILEDDLASSLGLVFHQGNTVLSLFISRAAEEL